MPRYASKQTARVDVLVLGEHPAACFAAVLLKQKSKLRVVLASIPPPERNCDRLVTLHPELFDLHPLLAGLGKSLSRVPIHGLMFLADRPETRSEHRSKSAIVHVARFSDIRGQFQKLTEAQGVETLGQQELRIHRVDEHGLELTLGKHVLKPSALIVACELPSDLKATLGIPDSWGPDVVHRFTSVRCKAGKHLNQNSKPMMLMSLDLRGQLCWGWLMPGDGEFQLAVEEPIEKSTARSGRDLLLHWAGVLRAHGTLGSKFEVTESSIESVDLPLAGALAHEGVANRTLLIGPAGGFYSACGEEIYPCCWSALFAADVMKKALKEQHLQDALNPYRQKWRTTLGDYLRGPQQNLRFLLPLVYRNPAMTARLAEAILLSKSVVR
jgi:flavin-dependent dehydrogenase